MLFRLIQTAASSLHVMWRLPATTCRTLMTTNGGLTHQLTGTDVVGVGKSEMLDLWTRLDFFFLLKIYTAYKDNSVYPLVRLHPR